MEILEIRSLHDLTASAPEQRRQGVHSYQLNCRQFDSLHREWKRNQVQRAPALGVMTLGFERIWITEEEIKRVAEAIQTTHSPVSIG